MKIMNVQCTLNYNYLVVLFTVVSVVTSCTNKVSMHNVVFKNSYLLATGRDVNEQTAKQNAMAELSHNFNTKIKSQTYNKIKRIIGISTNEKVENTFIQEVEIHSTIELPGVQVLKNEWDDNNKEFIVVIGLDRIKAKHVWLHQFEQTKSKLIGTLELIESHESPYFKYQNISRILPLWIEFEILMHKLKVIDVKVAPIVEKRLFELIRVLPRIKNEIRVHVTCQDNQQGWTENLIKKKLTQNRWSLVESRDAATLQIECSVLSKPVYQQNQEWKFALVSLSCQIIDTNTGTVINQISELTKSGHLTYEGAGDRAIKKLSPIVADKIVQALTETTQK